MPYTRSDMIFDLVGLGLTAAQTQEVLAIMERRRSANAVARWRSKAAGAPVERKPRGERFSPDAELSDESRAWAIKAGLPAGEVDAVFLEFRDYWCAVPGNVGIKLDWPATWRNRVRQVLGRRRFGRPIALTPYQKRQQEVQDVLTALRAPEPPNDQSGD